jgi:hypothetical protein
MQCTYNRASPGNAGACAPNPRQHHAAEAAITDLLQHLKSVAQRHRVDPWRGPIMGRVMSDSHCEEINCVG